MGLYRGWDVQYFHDDLRDRDVWTARQGGVGMNHNTEKGIKSMVDRKIVDRHRREADERQCDEDHRPFTFN